MLCAPRQIGDHSMQKLMGDLNREIKRRTATQRLLSNSKLAINAKISVNLLENASDRGRHSPATCLFFPPAGIFQRGGDTAGRRGGDVFGQLVASAQGGRHSKTKGTGESKIFPVAGLRAGGTRRVTSVR